MRAMNPFESAAINAMAPKVTIASSGPLVKLPFAAPAKFKPITITIVPVTTGGNNQLIQLEPADLTSKPTSARITPVTTTPPSAAPKSLLAPIAPAIGARNANEDPK